MKCFMKCYVKFQINDKTYVMWRVNQQKITTCFFSDSHIRLDIKPRNVCNIYRQDKPVYKINASTDYTVEYQSYIHILCDLYTVCTRQ